MLSADVQNVGIEVDESDHRTKSFNARQKQRAKNIADALSFCGSRGCEKQREKAKEFDVLE